MEQAKWYFNFKFGVKINIQLDAYFLLSAGAEGQNNFEDIAGHMRQKACEFSLGKFRFHSAQLFVQG